MFANLRVGARPGASRQWVVGIILDRRELPIDFEEALRLGGGQGSSQLKLSLTVLTMGLRAHELSASSEGEGRPRRSWSPSQSVRHRTSRGLHGRGVRLHTSLQTRCELRFPVAQVPGGIGSRWQQVEDPWRWTPKMPFDGCHLHEVKGVRD